MSQPLPREKGSRTHNVLAVDCALRTDGETAIFGEKCPVCAAAEEAREKARASFNEMMLRELGS